MKGVRYLFDGRFISAVELAKHLTAYSDDWLREALQDGCHSVADLVSREREMKKRIRQGGNRGSRSVRKQFNPYPT